jgi:hypothetical protein
MEFGKPEFADEENKQEKISITAKGNGWEIPVIGFLDLVYPAARRRDRPKDHWPYAIHDVGRASASARDLCQKAKGGNQSVKFLYVTPKKAAMLEDGDPAELLAQAKVQITRMEAFLRTLDKETAKAIVPVQPNSFYWKGNEALRKEFYGL